jgi:hypothetical protein
MGMKDCHASTMASVPTFVILRIGPFVFPDRKNSMMKTGANITD